MKKTLNTFFIAAIAISFNVNAAYVTTLSGSLGDYETTILNQTEIDDQVFEVVPGLFTDPIVAYTSLGNSGDPTEMDWMTAVLDQKVLDGSIIDYDQIWTLEKIEFETDADSDAFWTLLEDGIYTGDLTYASEYYLIKIGEGNLTFDTFLYENLVSLFEATITLGDLEVFSGFTGNNFDIYRVSHISAVPVPAAFWLFGTALIGFIGFSRRRIV